MSTWLQGESQMAGGDIAGDAIITLSHGQASDFRSSRERSILPARAPSRSPPSLIEVQMVGMCGVVIGREHSGEAGTGMVAYRVQEGRLSRFARPVPEHRDTATIGQHESGNVDGAAGFAVGCT